MAKSKFFRAFVEGQTVSDGRKVEAAWIDQIVGNFNPATAPVRINCEHIKGFSPEPPFNGYGDVIAVKAQTDTIEIDGKSVQRRALYCQVDGNDQLVAIRKAGQKPYPSVEISPNFAGTGKIGLIGLAVTDNPASLGVEALTFSALKPMFDGRKTAPENLFSAIELSEPIEFEAAPPAAEDGAINTFKSWLSGLVAGQPKVEEPKPIEQPKPANDNFAALLTEGLGKLADTIQASSATNSAAIAKVAGDLAALEAKIEQAPNGFSRRPAATGADATIETDC